jgi:EAL domain-containing protein (putative c-di-GMP-specific phosphodiesterase class I)
VLVDDEPVLLRAFARILEKRPEVIETFGTAREAVARVARGGVDVVVSDITMPEMSGVELLRAIREHDSDLPVVLMTGLPAVESATEAVEYGAFKYIVKPVSSDELRNTVDRAAQLHRLARMKREALTLLGVEGGASDRADLESRFERALGALWVAFQPIVRASDRTVFGYEALLRSDEPSLPGPGHVLGAAERLGQLTRLGRTIRRRAAEPVIELPGHTHLFVNLHPRDLMDPDLLDQASTLAQIADRVVLEITERASLGDIENVRATVARLRDRGFRIAVDDLGAGYAGLTSFALLEPEIVKLDMTLVRDIDTSPVKQKLVESMAALCRDMGLLIVSEGIETVAERDTLIQLGCDLFQGYLFARPGKAFPEPRWDHELSGPPRADLPMSGTHRISSPPVYTVREPTRKREPLLPLSVIDSLGDGVTLANAEGKIVFSNKAADRIVGVAATPEPPERWGEYYGVFQPDGSARFPTDEIPLLRALRGEDTNNVELMIRNERVPEGVVVSVTGRPIRDPQGTIVGASVVFRDITALREAERRLEASNAELLRANERLRELGK